MAAKDVSVLSLRMAILLNSLSLRKEVFDQVPPFVDVQINLQGLTAPRMLRNHDFGPAFVQVSDNGVGIKGLVRYPAMVFLRTMRGGDQSVEGHALDQGGSASGVIALSGQQIEADEIAQSVGQREDFGRHAPSGLRTPCRGHPKQRQKSV